MSWAKHVIEKLRQGHIMQICPRGGSMKGKIDSGNRVTLEPCDTTGIEVGDIVLCKVRGRDYLHLVKAIDGKRFLIGNNRGGTNGWIGPQAIYGKVTLVER